MVDSAEINIAAARQVLPRVLHGEDPRQVVAAEGLAQVSDASALESAVRQAIESNPAAVAEFRNGKDTVINFLKGQVMKATRGKANPAVAEELLRRLLA
jgi:aspartyl-tRNA(Asn)/glutamyl-tRNA(Gln) amidotransferase subunit B